MYGNKGITEHGKRAGDEDTGARRMDDSHHLLLERRMAPRRQE